MPGTREESSGNSASRARSMDRFLVKRPRDDAAVASGVTPAKEPRTEADAASCDPQTGANAPSSLPSGVSPDTLPAEVSDLIAPLAGSEWMEALRSEVSKPYFGKLAAAVAAQRAKKTVFPPAQHVFNAFTLTPLDAVRVVIIGQDPYHNTGQAHGLCFSVPHGIAIPPSLRNIYTELEADIAGFKRPGHGNLEAWARRGVLLLNASLTVRAHEANSHADLGWQTFTDGVIKVMNSRETPTVFILWGGFAQKKGKVLNRSRHCVIEAAHPSPLSVTKFRGCKVFSKANAFLEKKGREPIDWTV